MENYEKSKKSVANPLTISNKLWYIYNIMDKIEELLTRGVEKIYPSKEALEKVLRSGKKLKVYQGFDPTGIALHIGHLTGLMKLRQFQKLGHKVIFLIGDGTGQAGDPSGKTRPREKFLTQSELRKNAKDYVLQAKKIVQFEGDNPAEIRYNADWLGQLNFSQILNLASHFSLQYLEERDLFAERKKQGLEINLREFLYPLFQAYDSVVMKVDLEIGGSDQTFNMLAGRKLVREMLHKEKFVITTPLLTDSSGRKIGKTEGNAIALNAPPTDFYGLIMSLPDDVIAKCFEYLTEVPLMEVEKIKNDLASGKNPMFYKKKLAFTLIEMLHDQKKASEAQIYFEKTFQAKEFSKEIPVIKVNFQKATLVDLLMHLRLVKSKSEAKRLIKEGAIEIGGEKFLQPLEVIRLKDNLVIRVGKHRFVRISVS